MSDIDDLSPRDAPEQNMVPDAEEATAKKPKKSTFCVKLMKFLLSEAGLLLVVLAYILLGGLLFRTLELPAEMDAANTTRHKAGLIEEERRRIYHEILTTTNYALDNNHNRTWTVKEYKKILDRYQLMIIDAIADGYDGTVHVEAEEKYGWRLASAILFAATILTTIGYGHVAPGSQVGQLICIIYSTLAVPLMSIFLIKVGGAVARFIRLLYNKGLCVWCGRRRKGEKERDRSDNPHEFAKGRRVETEASRAARQVIADMGGSEADMPPPEYEWNDAYYKDEDEATPPTLLVLFIVCAYLLIGTVAFHLTEDGWSLVNSIYCCFITLTTLGFGDFVPGVGGSGITGSLLLAFTAFYVMVGLAVLAMGIDIIGETVAVAAAGVAVGDDEEGDGQEAAKAEETAPLNDAPPPSNRYDDDPNDAASVPDVL